MVRARGSGSSWRYCSIGVKRVLCFISLPTEEGMGCLAIVPRAGLHFATMAVVVDI